MTTKGIYTTIVGGRAPKTGNTHYSIQNSGIEQVLKIAAGDLNFRNDLFARRSEAAKDYGVNLSQSDSETIDEVPENQIKSLINAIVVRYRQALTTTELRI